MTYEDKVIEYIAQPENLPIAIEVADAVQNLRESLHRQFWPLFSKLFQEKLLASEFAERWKYVPFPTKRLKKEFEISRLKPANPKGADAPALNLVFGQGGREGHYRLLMGVVWSKLPTDPDHPILIDLKKHLLEQQLTNSWQWWPGWKSLNYSLEGGEFMLKFYHTPTEVTAELVEEYWNMFLALYPTLESINQELAG